MLKNITDKLEWEYYVQETDYNFYQSYDWGEFKKTGGWNTTRLLLKLSDSDFTMAQILEKNMLNVTVAWISGGPLVSRGSQLKSYEEFLQGLIAHYGNKRFILRMDQHDPTTPTNMFLLERHGYKRPDFIRTSGYTMHLALVDFEKKLSKNWRRNYQRSNSQNLAVEVHYDDSCFDEILRLYDETTELKKWGNVPDFKHIYQLYRYFAGNIVTFIVKQNNVPVSGRVILKYNNKAFDYIAGTSYAGRKIYASHFLVFHMLQWCKENSVEVFDFSGVSPTNMGVYNFKKGTGGDLIQCVGEWEISNSHMLQAMVNSLLAIRRRL